MTNEVFKFEEFFSKLESFNKEELNLLCNVWENGHDNVACKALKEYEEFAIIEESKLAPHAPSPVTYKDMERIALKYGTTIEAMKKHWKCIQQNK